jgi:hypothetical protein
VVKALGLTIPRSLLMVTDMVIELVQCLLPLEFRATIIGQQAATSGQPQLHFIKTINRHPAPAGR